MLQSGSFTLGDDQVIRFGEVFDVEGGTQDLAFEYLLPGQSVGIAAQVIYATLPENPDFNADGMVDGADFLVWQRTLGATGIGSSADGDGNGVVDAEDLQLWRENFGDVAGTASVFNNAHAVPEPTCLGLFLFPVLAAMA